MGKVFSLAQSRRNPLSSVYGPTIFMNKSYGILVNNKPPCLSLSSGCLLPQQLHCAKMPTNAREMTRSVQWKPCPEETARERERCSQRMDRNEGEREREREWESTRPQRQTLKLFHLSQPWLEMLHHYRALVQETLVSSVFSPARSLR